jgi:ATP-dependent Clp protease ATP-binding subunit ClpX
MARKIRMLILRKKKPDTNLLIAGIDAHICDKCIEQAHGIVLEELKSSGSSKLLGILF